MAKSIINNHKSYSQSQRAEQLTLIRDLIVFSINSGIINRKELQKAAQDHQILNRIDGQSFKYSSVYRYFDSFRYLHFDYSAKYDIGGDISWTEDATQLASYWEGHYGTNTLSENEKIIFRRCIFRSELKEQFLKHFCDQNLVPNNEREFLEFASPLYIVKQSVTRPNTITKIGDSWPEDWPSVKNVEISRDTMGINVIRKSQVEFLHTYRYWCLDTDIIDELNIREAERCGISKPESHVIFPVNRTNRDSEWLLQEILCSIQTRRRDRKVIPIPWLMYKICPKNGLSISKFKSLLLEAWATHRNIIHLERGPGGLIHNLRYQSQTDSPKERYGNHRYYLIIDGSVRSNLAVLSP